MGSPAAATFWKDFNEGFAKMILACQWSNDGADDALGRVMVVQLPTAATRLAGPASASVSDWALDGAVAAKRDGIRKAEK